MKRYVHDLHLADILNQIQYFVIVDDVHDVDLCEVNAADEIESDDEFLMSLPDDKLMDMTDLEFESIANIEVLDRIAKLDKSKLSRHQINLLRSEYSKKAVISESDIEKLLKLFQSCNKIRVSDRAKNNKFLAEYDLSANDMLSILHNLKPTDFDMRTRSINYSYLGDNIIILKPNILIPTTDVVVGANLYVKLDIDESTKQCAAFISIHPREFD